MFWRKQREFPAVTFATCVWERDWRAILLDPDYLPVRQISNHCFPFAERLLIVNNVEEPAAVQSAAQKWLDAGVLTRVVRADEIASEALAFFQLKREDFANDWIYYNALGPLSAIYLCGSEYLLYLTGDVRLDRPCDWIRPALSQMEQNDTFKVANLVWNEKYNEAKRESARTSGAFYIAEEGFSDQLFLVRRADFRGPIYGEIRADSHHFPRGDVFEKRVFSYMKNRGWQRMIFRRGSYTHENIEWVRSPEKV